MEEYLLLKMSRKRVNRLKDKRVKTLGADLKKLALTCFSGISHRMKFNFHFFDNTQFYKKSYSDLTPEEHERLGQQLIDLSEKSILEWRQEKMSSPRSTKFRSYGDFPSKSKYRCPKNIPENAEWVAFRLGSKLRLCGFMVPKEYNGQLLDNETDVLCSNTFYVVFYDHDHGFYLTDKQ